MEGWKRINGERVPLRDPNAKKVAIFKITNLLFKVYFQLKKWELCKNIITVIERPGSDSYIENLDMFPTVNRHVFHPGWFHDSKGLLLFRRTS
mgnify:CR=1 FL=1